MAAIYRADRELPIRKSHENPTITAIYEEFLKEPLGHKSHELLHTHYTPRPAAAVKIPVGTGNEPKAARAVAVEAKAAGGE